jgi:hypothetical protein
MRKRESYTLHDGDTTIQVDTFTMVPKRIVDSAGEVRDFDDLIHCPRMFPDRKESLVLWHLFKQIAHWDERRQVAAGSFSVNKIKEATGYDHKTIFTRLESLRKRAIIQWQTGKGSTSTGTAAINLKLHQWQEAPPKIVRRRPTTLDEDEALSSS